MIATPNYPYDAHSVWNRNQLGDLSTLMGNMPILLGAAVLGYLIWTNKIKF